MKLIHGDCSTLDLPRVKCIIADPPDNLGLAYDGFYDKHPMYYFWLDNVIKRAMEACDVLWLSYNQIHDHRIAIPAGMEHKKIIWMYTFGQYNKHDFGPSYRPILRISRPGTVFYPSAILEESERMRMSDSRAAGLRVPGDVWEFPRVVGNSKERRAWHPTQHPVALYERILRFSCTANDRAMDLFAGSGTCFRAARLTGIDMTGIEISKVYVEQLLSENSDVTC